MHDKEEREIYEICALGEDGFYLHVGMLVKMQQ